MIALYDHDEPDEARKFFRALDDLGLEDVVNRVLQRNLVVQRQNRNSMSIAVTTT